LNDLRWLANLAGFGALAIDAVARNRQSAVHLVKLFGVEADCLLATPAKPVCPCRMTQHNTVDAFVLLHQDFNPLIITGGFENLNRSALTFIHFRIPLGTIRIAGFLA
jgi:hypothetical protein